MEKAMIFTVTDSENGGKPIVWAQSASSKDMWTQERAMDLIEDWCNDNDVEITQGDLEDMAYLMRNEGYAWYIERFCFALTEING